jgi:DNA-binding NarL/FixJ family response regulator
MTIHRAPRFDTTYRQRVESDDVWGRGRCPHGDAIAYCDAARYILVVDISLNGPDSLDLLKEIHARHPDLPILILSMHDVCIYAERALRAGAQGFIMKQEATEKVLVALRRFLAREIYVSERIANRMLQRYIGSPDAGRTSSIAADRPGA